MRKSELIVKFIILSILWIGMVNTGMAQDEVCAEHAWDEYFQNRTSISMVCGTPGGACDLCIDTYHPEGPTLLPFNNVTCPPELCYTKVSSTPITDATPVLILLLGIYSVYLYRKRRVATKI